MRIIVPSARSAENRMDDERETTMPGTTNRSGLDALKDESEHVAKRSRPEMSQAIRNLVSAISYDDETLMESSQTSLYEALALAVRDIINKEIEASEKTKQSLREAWFTRVDGIPRSDFEDVRAVIESLIDGRIARMTCLRDEPVKLLEQQECPVENADQLEESIKAMRLFRENILADWPVPGKRPAAINRQAIAEARAAIGQKGKWLRKEEMIHPGKTEGN